MGLNAKTCCTRHYVARGCYLEDQVADKQNEGNDARGQGSILDVEGSHIGVLFIECRILLGQIHGPVWAIVPVSPLDDPEG